MEIRNRLYPYPVLAFNNDDYVESRFEVNVQTQILRNAIKMTFDLVLDNSTLAECIDFEIADFGIHIECPSTAYRDFFRFPYDHYEVEINAGKLNGKVSVCGFILAKEDIDQYSNPKFNRYFQDLEFQIERNNILAIAVPTEIPIEKDYDDVKGASSIFAVVPNHSLDAALLEFSMDSDVLYLRVPLDEFNKYKMLRFNESYMKTMHSLLIVPVLVKIFELFKNTETDLMEEYSDRKWFRSLKKSFEKKGLEFDTLSLKNTDSLKLAQMMTENPIIGTIDQLFNNAFSGGGVGDED